MTYVKFDLDLCRLIKSHWFKVVLIKLLMVEFAIVTKIQI